MKKILLVIIGGCFSQLLLAQMTTETTSKNYQYFQRQRQQIPTNLYFTKQIQSGIHSSLEVKQPNATTNELPVPLAYAYKDLAFFCKIEVQLEKSIKMPVKFRLGSVDYVDYLEGKRDSY